MEVLVEVTAETMLDAASWILLLGGTAFCVIGGVGVVRMPDFYTRSHAAGITDTLGSTLLLAGLGLQAGLSLVTVKLVFILLFIYITTPTATHALVKAAFSGGVAAWGDHDMEGEVVVEGSSRVAERASGVPAGEGR